MLNSAVKYCKSLSAEITFRRCMSNESSWAVFADAGYATSNDVKSHQGAIIFRAFGRSKVSIVHPISSITHKIRRVVRSTLAAESISCADAFDLGVYLNAILKEIGLFARIHLTTDSKSLYDLMSTTQDSKERRLKLGIACSRESFHNGEIERISWVPSRMQLGDALTKDNREASAIVDCTLSDRRFREEYGSTLTIRHNGVRKKEERNVTTAKR